MVTTANYGLLWITDLIINPTIGTTLVVGMNLPDVPAAEEVVDMRGGSAELTQTYFYSLVR